MEVKYFDIPAVDSTGQLTAKGSEKEVAKQNIFPFVLFCELGLDCDK
jgi:hypothetical protein